MHAIYGIVFFQAEDGIRDLVRSRGLGDVYKRQVLFVGSIGNATKSFKLNTISPCSFNTSIL